MEVSIAVIVLSYISISVTVFSAVRSTWAAFARAESAAFLFVFSSRSWFLKIQNVTIVDGILSCSFMLVKSCGGRGILVKGAMGPL
jgi:hypothetical protein